ncbi:MAG: glycosyltransferase family 39 protein [Patescibacteria group bacterium]|nr:glycosyltransferase family 39 protein [Patescibacteria group bacterium]
MRNFILRAKKIINTIKYNWPIIVIIGLAFIVRWRGIYFDYPYGVNYIWDEVLHMTYLMEIIERKSVFIQGPPNPVLLPLLYFPILILRILYIGLREGIYGVDELKGYIIGSGLGQIFIIIRWYAVFFGTATVYLVYRIGKLIFKNKFSFYYASLVYALSLVPVYLSHWGKAHVPMVFFLVFSLFFILKFEQEKKIKFFYWSTAMAACSLSVHYVGLTAAIFPFLGFIFNKSIILSEPNIGTSQKPFIGKLLRNRILIKSFILYAAIASFFYLTVYSSIVRFVTSENSTMSVGALERFYYIFRGSFRLDPVFTVLSLAIIILCFKKFLKHRIIRYIMYGLFFNYLLMATIFASPIRTRLLLVFMTLSVPLAAGYLVGYLKNRNLKNFYIYLIAFLLILPSGFATSRWLNLVENNTSIEIVGWLRENLKKDEVAYYFSENKPLNAPLSYEAALWHKENNGVENSKKINYIIGHKDEFKGKGIDLRSDLYHNRFEDLGGEETKYVIVFYFRASDVSGKTVSLPRKKQADDILENVRKYHHLELVKTFSPTNNKEIMERGDTDVLNNPQYWKSFLYLEKSGPLFEIYEIIK